MKRTLKEEYLGKDSGGLGYFQMGGGIKRNSLYNRKNGKPSRDPGIAALRETDSEESIIDHLKKRNIDFDKTKVITDLETNQATFLLYNLSGQLVGYQKYNPKGSKDYRNSEIGRYFTHVTKNPDRNIAVWGLESIDERPFMFVTEGIFDAVRLHNLGLPAIAVLASHPTYLRSWLKALSKTVIAILDNDAAGDGLKSIAHQSIKVPSPYKDLGEMKSEDEIHKWLKTHFDWL